MIDLTNQKKIDSCFYIGHTFHKRFTPKLHSFKYPLYMAFIDLSETELLQKKFLWFSNRRFAPAELRTSDHFRNYTFRDSFNKDISLYQKTLIVAQDLGADISSISKIKALTHLRTFGLYFSPVNFFFLYHKNKAKYMIAEVSNTPWNKNHCYLINLNEIKTHPKEFHVSPFMDLNMSYKWNINVPTNNVKISISNILNSELLFIASFKAKRYKMNNINYLKLLLRWPISSISILKKIYCQALKLFLKKIPFVPYQNKS